ncbi:hypothetical protein [Nonomuraea sp. KM88]|uniref:hypothetical protein n=1 Tax=Nonomuraea sp. KM88 TaxID=3457427 RepID=UPI003FCEE56B
MERERPSQKFLWIVLAPVAVAIIIALVNGPTGNLYDWFRNEQPSPSTGAGSPSAPPAETAQPSSPPSETPIGDDPPPIYRQKGINLSKGYTISFSDRPIRPNQENGTMGMRHDGYVSVRGGRQVVLLKPGQPREYRTCRDDTRYYQHVTIPGIPGSKLPEGAALCVTDTDSGLITLVKVTGWSDSDEDADYMTLDITVWQGPVYD